ncbi:hypothetical protein [Peterkaempfera griseoplana]|uniref:hypothetical protein n=1 Tax=Peterkaempfera griseoplana TaxID=66896 RepID=UPI0006E374A9|nr:hypothetical protein [Peterkaempfera griseoplana]
MDIDWQAGSRTVRWGDGAAVEKTFAHPPASVVRCVDPPGVLVVESLEGGSPQPSNAVVFDEDGTERLRLAPPELPEPSWRIGYYLAYEDPQGRLLAVYATRVGDLWGRPDLTTGELLDVHEWR